jgi:hypothetical protein
LFDLVKQLLKIPFTPILLTLLDKGMHFQG